MKTDVNLLDRPISMEYGSGRRHTIINGFYYCETERIANVGTNGEDIARVRDEHFLKEHPSEYNKLPEGEFWSKSAVVVAKRKGGFPVLSTQLEKMDSWTDHYDDEGGQSFQCRCGWRSVRMQPGELYPTLAHDCSYVDEGWRVRAEALETWTHRTGERTVHELTASPESGSKITRAVVEHPSRFAFTIEPTDTEIGLRLPDHTAHVKEEVGGVLTGWRILKGINIRVPRELRVPHRGEFELFRPTPTGGLSLQTHGIIMAVLPNRPANVALSVDTTQEVVGKS